MPFYTARKQLLLDFFSKKFTGLGDYLKSLVLFTAIYGLSVQAQGAQMWMLDIPHTSVNFDINHFFSEVKGNFTDFDGTFHFDPSNVKGSKLAFTVNVKSVDTDNAKRDNHLQSPDFFNATDFPEISSGI